MSLKKFGGLRFCYYRVLYFLSLFLSSFFYYNREFFLVKEASNKELCFLDMYIGTFVNRNIYKSLVINLSCGYTEK